MNKQIGSLLILSAVLAVSVVAQKPESHPLSDKKDRCAACHAIPSPTPGSHEIRADIDQACEKCHPRGRENHSIGVTPTFSVPSDLVMGPDGKMSCITCHVPHTPRWSDHSWQATSLAGSLKGLFAKRHQTYFLRRNNAHGDLCLSCHRSREEK